MGGAQHGVPGQPGRRAGHRHGQPGRAGPDQSAHARRACGSRWRRRGRPDQHADRAAWAAARRPTSTRLIDLITTTVEPQTWDEVGGPGSISEFRNNLSLVISQTQEVHEEIVDLLEQLRRLQDLQVTIEVRFITLNDNFFERIGVDFQFNIDEPSSRTIRRAWSPSNKKEIVGLRAGGRQRRVGIRPTSRPTCSTFPSAKAASTWPRRSSASRCEVGALRLRHPQRHRSLLPDQRGPGRSPQQRAASAQGHAVQRPAGVGVRQTTHAVRDQRDSGRGRLRRRPAAGHRRALRRHAR